MKPNCYNCIHRRDVPGDAHSSCLHPVVINGGTVPIPTCGIAHKMRSLGVKGHQQGMENGWFMWPVNFDPVWLESCDGFEEKQEASNP